MQRFFREHRALMMPVLVGVAYLSILAIGMLRRDHGLPTALQIRGECAALRRESQQLRAENQLLQQEWQRLTSDPRHVEKLAREQLHMVNDRETVFVFSD